MTSVLHQSSAYLSTTGQPTITGDFTYGIWLKAHSAQYGTGTYNPLFGFGISGGSSEGFIVQVAPATNTVLDAFVFRNAGSDIQTQQVLTGSDTGWVFVSLRHSSGSSSYDLSYRRENQTSFTTVTLTLTTQLVSAGSLYIGASQFNVSVDSCSRSFFCQQARLSDAALLLASKNRNSAPTGTNLHWLDLDSATNAGVNGGTAGNWTITGTLQTDASEPTETSGRTYDAAVPVVFID